MNINEKIFSRNINIHGFFKSISNSFISLFLPIEILRQTSFDFAMVYLIVFYLSVSLFDLLLFKFLKSRPLISIAIHFCLYLISYILMSTIDLNLGYIIMIGILNGTGNAMYYIPVQTIISQSKKTENFALFQIFKTLGIVVITLVNGYILNLNSSNSLLITCVISFVFFLISYLPFLQIRGYIKPINDKNISLKEAFKSLKNYHTFNVLFGLQDFIVSIIIPLFLTINNLSIKSIAYLIVIINLLKIILNICSNLMYKHKKSMIAVSIGSLMFALSCIVIGINRNPEVLYVFSVIPSITFPFFYLTTFKEYTRISEDYIFEAIVLREVLVHIFRIFLIVPMFFVKDLSVLIYLGIPIAVFMIIFAVPYFKKRKSDNEIKTEKILKIIKSKI